MSPAPAFSPRVAVALGGLVLVIFAASLLLTGRGGRDTGESFGANTYSRSAIGHLALYDMLRALGREAVRADVDPLAQLGARGVLVLAEPSEKVPNESYRRKIKNAKRVLLILPKWEAIPDPDHPDWIGEARLIPKAVAESALFPVDANAAVKDAPSPIWYTTNRLSVGPTIAQTAQLAQRGAMKPALANENGVLVGEILDLGRRIVVLVDPDPIENHGLWKGENAAFALALFDFVGGPGAKFVFDETIHGFHGRSPTGSPALALLRFPYNLLALQGFVAAALLVIATIGRFGPPLPAPRAYAAGKAALISNIAQLIDHGRHHGHALKRYVGMTAQESAVILHAPEGLEANPSASPGLTAPAKRAARALLAARSCSRRKPRETGTWRGCRPLRGQSINGSARLRMELADVRGLANAVCAELRKAVIGQDDAIELLLTSLFCGGHVLIEGVPGTAKTMLARAFAASLSLRFGRVQFTPDLMPGDLLGTNIFNFQTNAFTLTPGPIFTDVLLADEINRTPPKTQAALLQAMHEHGVTIDGVLHNLGENFMVVATQNPIEQQGTYPLPEAQLDRFLFKILISYPSRNEERGIVARHGHQAGMPNLADLGLGPVVSRSDLAAARALVAHVKLGEPLVDYIVDLVRATRGHAAIEFGASPRAANMLASASRAHAALDGRAFVIPDDVKLLAAPVLRHRIVLSPSAEIEGVSPDSAAREIVGQVAAPR